MIDRVGVKSCVIRCTSVEKWYIQLYWLWQLMVQCCRSLSFLKSIIWSLQPQKVSSLLSRPRPGWLKKGSLEHICVEKMAEDLGYVITMLSSHRTASRHTKWIKSWRWWTSMVQPTVPYWKAIATWCVHQQTLKANPEGILVRLHSHISWWLSWPNGEDQEGFQAASTGLSCQGMAKDKGQKGADCQICSSNLDNLLTLLSFALVMSLRESYGGSSKGT